MHITYDPTPQLRWLKRKEEVQGAGESPHQEEVTVLQFGLRRLNSNQWDWFDVPTVEE
jgi:hypothetical protein